MKNVDNRLHSYQKVITSHCHLTLEVVLWGHEKPFCSETQTLVGGNNAVCTLESPAQQG